LVFLSRSIIDCVFVCSAILLLVVQILFGRALRKFYFQVPLITDLGMGFFPYVNFVEYLPEILLFVEWSSRGFIFRALTLYMPEITLSSGVIAGLNPLLLNCVLFCLTLFLFPFRYARGVNILGVFSLFCAVQVSACTYFQLSGSF
jgi:hypothetical protein